MAKFKKGDICEIVKTYRNHDLLGAEVTITGEKREYKIRTTGEVHMAYPTDMIHKGRPIYALEESLRLKDRPTDLAEIVYGALLDRMTGKVVQ